MARPLEPKEMEKVLERLKEHGRSDPASKLRAENALLREALAWLATFVDFTDIIPEAPPHLQAVLREARGKK